MDDLERGLITEVSSENADTGGSFPLMEITVRPGAMPSVTITDRRGVADHRRISFVELLKALDDSATVSALRREDVKTTELPSLPKGTLRASLIERPRGNSYLITGWVGAGERTFVLDSDGHRSAHQIPLPAVLYSALYDEGAGAVTGLWLSMLSPEREGGAPAEDEPLYRWCFSNTYAGLGEVCWPTMRNIGLDAGEIPQKVVEAFFSVVNNRDLYGAGLSQNSPHRDYRELLEAIEANGGLEAEWLIPAPVTVGEVHDELRR